MSMQRARQLLGDYSFVVSLVYLTIVSASFFVAGAISNHSLELWYLIWNLFLAWVPLFLVLWLLHMLRSKPWSSWQGIAISLLWLGFLPNSFYMVSDFIHLQDYQRADLVFDTAMFASFVLTSLFLGYASLYLVHVELVKRFKKSLTPWLWVGAILLLCSFAIYLGRDLRLNTWDILVSPSGLLFDLTSIFLHPVIYGIAFSTTATFFALLMSVYIVVWQFVRKPHANYKSPH